MDSNTYASIARWGFGLTHRCTITREISTQRKKKVSTATYVVRYSLRFGSFKNTSVLTGTEILSAINVVPAEKRFRPVRFYDDTKVSTKRNLHLFVLSASELSITNLTSSSIKCVTSSNSRKNRMAILAQFAKHISPMRLISAITWKTTSQTIHYTTPKLISCPSVWEIHPVILDFAKNLTVNTWPPRMRWCGRTIEITIKSTIVKIAIESLPLLPF